MARVAQWIEARQLYSSVKLTGLAAKQFYLESRPGVFKVWSPAQHPHVHLELVRNAYFGPRRTPNESETLVPNTVLTSPPSEVLKKLKFDLHLFSYSFLFLKEPFTKTFWEHTFPVCCLLFCKSEIKFRHLLEIIFSFTMRVCVGGGMCRGIPFPSYVGVHPKAKLGRGPRHLILYHKSLGGTKSSRDIITR